MKFFKYLFLASTMLVVSCPLNDDFDGPCSTGLKVINNSEHNITRLVIVNTNTDEVVTDVKNNELVAKGDSKMFEHPQINGFIVCIETEGTLEPVCTYEVGPCADLFIWNGSYDSNEWFPATFFPKCPIVFTQCNSEAKDD
jgi:hypothetical protein